MGTERTPWERALSIARAEANIGQESPANWEEIAEERKMKMGCPEVENLLPLAREIVAARENREKELEDFIIGQLDEVLLWLAGVMDGHLHSEIPDKRLDTPFGDDICNEQWRIFMKGVMRSKKLEPAPLYSLWIIIGRAIRELVEEINVSQFEIDFRNALRDEEENGE